MFAHIYAYYYMIFNSLATNTDPTTPLILEFVVNTSYCTSYQVYVVHFTQRRMKL